MLNRDSLYAQSLSSGEQTFLVGPHEKMAVTLVRADSEEKTVVCQLFESYQPNRLCFWYRADQFRQRHVLPTRDRLLCQAIEFSQDDRLLVTASADTFRIWEAHSRAHLFSIDASLGEFVFLRDEHYHLLSKTGDRLVLWTFDEDAARAQQFAQNLDEMLVRPRGEAPPNVHKIQVNFGYQILNADWLLAARADEQQLEAQTQTQAQQPAIQQTQAQQPAIQQTQAQQPAIQQPVQQQQPVQSQPVQQQQPIQQTQEPQQQPQNTQPPLQTPTGQAVVRGAESGESRPKDENATLADQAASQRPAELEGSGDAG